MLNKISADTARDILLALPIKNDVERISLSASYRRVLAGDITASVPAPPFDRSPYDGYAFRGEDTAYASKENPAELAITEEIPAGKVPTVEVTAGKAAKILTGAPIPKGANATIKYENTEYSDKWVRIFEPVRPDTDVVYAGEDIKKGQLIAADGSLINAPLMGIFASQGLSEVCVYKKPYVTIINTGSELTEVGKELSHAKIYNSNVYTLSGYLQDMGLVPHNGGIVEDDPELIAAEIKKALECSDIVITTGGSSVGDYDWSVTAAERLGARILFWKIDMKPGGAMVASTLEGKLILSLSGSPGAAILGLFRIALPYLRKLCGRSDIFPEIVEVISQQSFDKASAQDRILRGRLIIKDGIALFSENSGQGNGIMSSLTDCDLLAEIPAGSPPLPAGSKIKAYRL